VFTASVIAALDDVEDPRAITVIASLAAALGSLLQKRGQEMDDKR